MIEIVKFEPMDKGSLKGKMTIKIHKMGGLVIEDIAIMEKESKKWISFPSKKTVIDGQDKWMPLIYFDAKDIQNKFCLEIIKAYENYQAL